LVVHVDDGLHIDVIPQLGELVGTPFEAREIGVTGLLPIGRTDGTIVNQIERPFRCRMGCSLRSK